MSDLLALAESINNLASAIRDANGAAPAAPAADKGKAAPAAKKADAKPKTKDYETEVRPELVKLSKKDREAMAEVLGQFTNPSTGEPCTKGVEVDPKDYDALLQATADKLSELDV
ncbi:hypothetical protein JessAGP_007 [Caulobacter phage Jess A]|nr:hypothetical protein JessAGP_007 [Caulobacter phage Jess A]